MRRPRNGFIREENPRSPARHRTGRRVGGGPQAVTRTSAPQAERSSYAVLLARLGVSWHIVYPPEHPA